MRQIGMPASHSRRLRGTAQVFQQSLNSEPMLIAAALVAVYIVLGVLYESFIHPITILSTLPSAGVGAVLALMLFNTEFSIIALIGVILLIGIVKKNAIMMIDFALDAERTNGLDAREAIFQACLMRFRPIMMTTSAAMLGALPLALSFGDGGEMRRPLGISIVGGLIVSQMLTLYTTPVMYLYLDRFRAGSRSGSGIGRSPVWLRRRLPSDDARLGLLRAAWLLAGCKVGPDYKRPARAGAAGVQGTGRAGRPASRRDAIDKGAWWSVYHDPRARPAGAEVEVSNQNVQAVRGPVPQRRRPWSARRGPACSRRRPSARRSPAAAVRRRQQQFRLEHDAASGATILGTTGSTSGSSRVVVRERQRHRIQLSGTVAWDLDVWGSIRRQVESSTAAAPGQRRRSGEREAVRAGDAGDRLFRPACRGFACRSC